MADSFCDLRGRTDVDRDRHSVCSGHDGGIVLMNLTKTRENIKAREAAEEMLTIAQEYVFEQRLDEDQANRYWRYIHEFARKEAGIEEESKKYYVHSTQWNGDDNDDPNIPDDNEPFPFGQYGPKGQELTYGEVPEDYLVWCAQQDWIENWSRVYAYICHHGHDEE